MHASESTDCVGERVLSLQLIGNVDSVGQKVSRGQPMQADDPLLCLYVPA